jgi:hypothetical protein
VPASLVCGEEGGDEAAELVAAQVQQVALVADAAGFAVLESGLEVVVE